MSRIGNLPIKIPTGVTVSVENQKVTIKGPKGELSLIIPRNIEVEIKNELLVVSNKKGESYAPVHGTTRAHLSNMVHGVSEGWSKELEMVGTGYRCEVKGDTVILTVGFSHPVELSIPNGISLEIDKTRIIVKGSDKEMVGHFSALIRSARPPEPYKGKGIKYVDEYIRRKAGKAAKGAEGSE